MAFFMTLGSASSASVQAGAHQCPPGAGASAATSARCDRERSAKCVNPCSTGAATRLHAAAKRRRRAGVHGPRATPLPGHFAHAAEQPARRAAAEQDRAVGAPRDEGDAVARRPSRCFGAFTGSSDCRPSRRARQARTRGRARRRASAACRSSRRDPSAPRRTRRRGRAGRAAAACARMSGLGTPAAASSMAKSAGDHPLDIAVDHGDRLVEGDRRDRRGGVGADAREAARALPRCRESARPGRAATARAQAMRLRARE